MIRFYNTLNKRVEPFEPLTPGKVKMYTCGPTVYDHAHIGNYRTFVWEDLLKRFLLWEGFDVLHVKNLTDIDDRTINRANEEGVPLRELTDRYAAFFFEDMKTLGCLPANVYPRATEHIPEMIALIEDMERNGHTYVSKGSVYFRISSLEEYGCLCTVDLGGTLDGARVDSDEYEKESARDFVLWKGEKPGEPSWDSPWGKGRPGWHLECSAMARRYLGDTFDIHTGGIDLVFPHHENEIAQSRGATGKNPVRYWLHALHLMTDSEKMSKRLGNFHTVRDLVEGGTDPMALRYLYLSVHYRKQLNFTAESLEAAKSALARIRDFARRMKEQTLIAGANPVLEEEFRGYRRTFRSSLEDDLNTAEALAGLFEGIRAGNSAMDRGGFTEDAQAETGELLSDFSRVFGIPLFDEVILPEEIEALIRKRQDARKNRDFGEADRIRDDLNAKGILLEDTPDGVRWKKK